MDKYLKSLKTREVELESFIGREINGGGGKGGGIYVCDFVEIDSDFGGNRL